MQHKEYTRSQQIDKIIRGIHQQISSSLCTDIGTYKTDIESMRQLDFYYNRLISLRDTGITAQTKESLIELYGYAYTRYCLIMSALEQSPADVPRDYDEDKKGLYIDAKLNDLDELLQLCMDCLKRLEEQRCTHETIFTVLDAMRCCGYNYCFEWYAQKGLVQCLGFYFRCETVPEWTDTIGTYVTYNMKNGLVLYTPAGEGRCDTIQKVHAHPMGLLSTHELLASKKRHIKIGGLKEWLTVLAREKPIIARLKLCGSNTGNQGVIHEAYLDILFKSLKEISDAIHAGDITQLTLNTMRNVITIFCDHMATRITDQQFIDHIHTKKRDIDVKQVYIKSKKASCYQLGIPGINWPLLHVKSSEEKKAFFTEGGLYEVDQIEAGGRIILKKSAKSCVRGGEHTTVIKPEDMVFTQLSSHKLYDVVRDQLDAMLRVVALGSLKDANIMIALHTIYCNFLIFMLMQCAPQDAQPDKSPRYAKILFEMASHYTSLDQWIQKSRMITGTHYTLPQQTFVFRLIAVCQSICSIKKIYDLCYTFGVSRSGLSFFWLNDHFVDENMLVSDAHAFKKIYGSFLLSALDTREYGIYLKMTHHHAYTFIKNSLGLDDNRYDLEKKIASYLTSFNDVLHGHDVFDVFLFLCNVFMFQPYTETYVPYLDKVFQLKDSEADEPWSKHTGVVECAEYIHQEMLLQSPEVSFTYVNMLLCALGKQTCYTSGALDSVKTMNVSTEVASLPGSLRENQLMILFLRGCLDYCRRLTFTGAKKKNFRRHKQGLLRVIQKDFSSEPCEEHGTSSDRKHEGSAVSQGEFPHLAGCRNTRLSKKAYQMIKDFKRSEPMKSSLHASFLTAVRACSGENANDLRPLLELILSTQCMDDFEESFSYFGCRDWEKEIISFCFSGVERTMPVGLLIQLHKSVISLKTSYDVGCFFGNVSCPLEMLYYRLLSAVLLNNIQRHKEVYSHSMLERLREVYAAGDKKSASYQDVRRMLDGFCDSGSKNIEVVLNYVFQTDTQEAFWDAVNFYGMMRYSHCAVHFVSRVSSKDLFHCEAHPLSFKGFFTLHLNNLQAKDAIERCALFSTYDKSVLSCYFDCLSPDMRSCSEAALSFEL